MSASGTKVWVACVSTVIGVSLAWWIWHSTRERGTVSFVGDPDAVQDLLVERRTGDARASVRSGDDVWDEALVRQTITPEEAPQLFTMPPQTFDYDPFTYYRYKPMIHEKQTWAEHAGGFFEKRTNSLGMREDGELPEHMDLFVVAAGDSHTDGLCANSESYPNRLESALRERYPERTIEVVNTGVTGFSFYNYLGALEKFAEKKPKAFVVAFYGGNDFLEVLKPWHFFNRTAPPPRTSGYWARIEAAKALGNAGVAMAYNQIVYFQYYPDQIDVAAQAAIRVCAEIARQCAAGDIELVFVYIPPGFAVDGALEPDVAAAKELLELSDGDLQQYHRLADRLMAALRAHHVTVIDLREHFTEKIEKYYWSDRHINLKGHQLIADLVLQELAAHPLLDR